MFEFSAAGVAGPAGRGPSAWRDWPEPVGEATRPELAAPDGIGAASLDDADGGLRPGVARPGDLGDVWVFNRAASVANYRHGRRWAFTRMIAAMDASAQVEVIVGLLAKVGVQVRYEHLGGDGGGLCRIRGSSVLFVDLDADIATTADRCLNALAAMPEAEHLAMPSEIRQRLSDLRKT